jgi:group I intron endonuclease
MHLSQLRINKHHSVKLQRHYNKYGEEDLFFSILYQTRKEDVLLMEQVLLDIHKPYFNNSYVAGSPRGCKRSKKTIEKHRKQIIGKPSWNKGIPMSEETKRKDSESHIGKIPWMKGKHHKAESNQKNRDGHLGKKHSDSTINKLKERIPWNKGLKKKKGAIGVISKNNLIL